MKATTSTTTKSTKQVQVIARVEFKSDPRKVVYFNRSSDGTKEYQTFLFEGHATSCTCPATKPCYHMMQCEAIEGKRTVIGVGAIEVSGVTPAHAVAKALKIVQARVQVAPDSYLVAGELPVETAEEADQRVWLESLVTETDELPELPEQEEEFRVEFFDEEFSEELAEVWTEEEIAKIRTAAQTPKIAPVVPQAAKWENAPLNGNRRSFADALVGR